MSTLRVAVLHGGRGQTHELPCRSADAVIRHLDRDHYDVLPVVITPDGRWVTEHDDLAPHLAPLASIQRVLDILASVDVVFPCSHGDAGAVQSVLRFGRVRHVGSGVTATAAAGDTDLARKLLAAEDIPVADAPTGGDGRLSVGVGVLEYPDGSLATAAGPDSTSAEVTDRIGDLALRSFKALGCAGLLHVDLLVREGAGGRPEVVVDSIDTMPDLSADAPFARLWETAGLAYPKLLDLLVETAAGQRPAEGDSR